MRVPYLFFFLSLLSMLGSHSVADAAAGDEPVKKVVLKSVDDKDRPREQTYDVRTDAGREAFLADLDASIRDERLRDLQPKKEANVMAIRWDLGLWAIVVFVLLFLILRTGAWGPILEGLQKREESIRSAVEEAKIARAETARIRAQFKAEMDAKFAEIPKIMEEARRDAENLKEEFRSQAAKEVAADRQRLRREIDSARDQALKEIWESAAHLATLISAKVIGKSLSEEDHRRLIDESLGELRPTAPQPAAHA